MENSFQKWARKYAEPKGWKVEPLGNWVTMTSPMGNPYTVYSEKGVIELVAMLTP